MPLSEKILYKEGLRNSAHVLYSCDFFHFWAIDSFLIRNLNTVGENTTLPIQTDKLLTNKEEQ